MMPALRRTTALAAALAIAFAAAGAARGAPSSRLETALDLAKRARKPLFVMVGSNKDAASRQMDVKTLRDGAVQALLSRYVVCRLDADLHAADVALLAQKTGAAVGAALPEIHILSPDGAPLDRASGFVEPDRMVKLLQAALDRAGG